MSRINIKSLLMLVIALIGFCTQARAQNYFKEYIDSDEDCDEFNTQVIVRNDSIFLINFISCDSSFYHTNVLLYNSSGRNIKKVVIEELVSNVYSGHLVDEFLFLVGVNNDEKPNSKLVLWNGELGLNHHNISKMELIDSSTEVYLNTMGSIGMDSNKVIYGQYSVENNPKVFSFLLWLNLDQSRDSLMIFDSSYVWSNISDAKVDSSNNLYILSDASKVVDHIIYNYRILIKYNSEKQKVFEWVSEPFGVNEGIPSFTLLDSATYVLELVAEENGHIHSLIAINKESELLWEHIFHIDDPKSLYRVNDIITCKDGGILCCGTYRNVSENTIETGYVCKLDRFGNLLWERVFYDQEELHLPQSGINKVIHFNSIVESTENSIVIGGRVIHNFLSLDSKSDVLLIVLDSTGCINKNCQIYQDVTRLNNFLAPGKTWTEAYEWNENIWSFRYTFDTIPIDIGGKVYYELLRSDSEYSNNWYSAGTFMRIENGIVFQNGIGGAEQMIYNFNLLTGDSFYLGDGINTFEFVVEKIDTISLLNGDLKKRWTLQPLNPNNPNADNTVIWVEDIGNINGLLTNYLPWIDDAEYSTILCVKWLENIVFDNPNVDSCWIIITNTNEKREEDIIIYPNPANNEVSILGLESEIERLQVYNICGKLVFQGKSDHILLNGLPAGYYFLIIQLENFGYKSLGFIKI